MKSYIIAALLVFPSLVFGSIGFDYSEYAGHASGDKTWSHITTGTDPILLVYCWVNNGSDTVTSITYNGDNLTKLNTVQSYNGAGNRGYLYYILNPDLGTHNVVLDVVGSDTTACVSSSYTGVDQSEPFDGINYDAGSGSYNNFTIGTTTARTGTWLVSGQNGLDGNCTAGTDTTMRETTNPTLGDSNMGLSPGTNELSYISCGNRMEDILLIGLAQAEEDIILSVGTTTQPMQAETYATVLFVFAIALILYTTMFLYKKLRKK